MSRKQGRKAVVKKVVAGNKVKLIEGEVFAIDPSKRYLVVLKSGAIDAEKLRLISNTLQRKFGNTFMLAVPPDTSMQIVETEPNEGIKEGDVVGLQGFGKADGQYRAGNVKPTDDGQSLQLQRTCRVCGCTDGNCDQCVAKTGQPCTWVETDLCSACQEPGK